MNKPSQNAKGTSLFRWLLYLGLVFLFQEVVLRICFPVPEIRNLDRSAYISPENSEHPFTRNTTRYWQSQPDTNAIFDHEMNQYGFRDHEWTIAKPEGKKRILFIGDSFVEGVMASQDETIPIGFQQALGSETVDVMNGGILGKGLNAYMQAFSDLIPIYKPDVVFLCLYANDMGKVKPVVPQFYLEPGFFPWYEPRFYTVVQEAQMRGPLNPVWSNRREGYLPELDKESNPWRLNEAELAPHVSPRLASHMKAGTFNPFTKDGLAQLEHWLSLTPKLGEALPFFNYICQQNQAQPVVVYLPNRHQVSKAYLSYELETCRVNCPADMDLTKEEYQQHQQVIAQQCEQFGLTFLDMTSWVRDEEAKGRRLFWNYDEHMKGFAYLELGRAIANDWNQNK